MTLGIYRCSKCNKSYTKSETKNLKKKKNGTLLCKTKVIGKKGKTRYVGCGGKVIEIKAVKKLNLKYSEFQAGVERFYYDLLERMRDAGYNTEKVKDVYTASESSDFWGDIERRKQTQAEQAMKYIANIGNMTKTIFQLIRELRLLDQRLEHYVGRDKGNKSDDIALKGIWIDKVEGGAKVPSSIYGMAVSLGFATLPDLFFKIFPPTKNDVDKYVDALKKKGMNRKVREVLKRKLAEFMDWYANTKMELKDGRKFKLAYLRQHFHIIRMYMDWVRPYLQHVDALNLASLGGKRGTKAWTELIRAAEGAVIDLELFGEKEDYSKKMYRPCIKLTFHYNTVPMMAYSKQYHKGAIHVGNTQIDFESYVLTEKDIEKYKKSEFEDDIAVLAAVNSAISSYRKELLKYLEEAEDDYAKSALDEIASKKKSKKKKSKKGAMAFLRRTRTRINTFKLRKEKKKAEADAGADLWSVYDKFKKHFGMMRF